MDAEGILVAFGGGLAKEELWVAVSVGDGD